MGKRLGIATSTEPFLSIFRRYFQAAGYDVVHLRSPEDAVESLGSRQLHLLVIDSQIMNGTGADWDGIPALAASTSVPVLAAVPREQADTLRESTKRWAGGLITYPMNPEAVQDEIVSALGDEAQSVPELAADVPAETLVGPETVVGPGASPAWTQRVVSKVLREQPALHSVEASMAILDQISDAVFVFARTGEMVMVNETACRMLGYQRDEILGRSAGIVFSQLENPPLVEGLDLRHAMSRFAVPVFDTALRTASGHSIAVSFGTSFLRDETGNVIGILGIARDIRERKSLEEHLRRYGERLEEEVRSRTAEIEASEQKHRMLVDQIASAVVCTDPEGRMSSFNRAARRLFGWDDRLIGEPLSHLWCCQDCEAEESCHEAVKSRGEWAGECTIPLANGATAVMFHSCSALVDGSGRPAGVAHVVSDLSDPTGFQRELLRDTQGLVVCDHDGQRQIITCSDKMRRVMDMIAMSADSSETVLIEGESGTGKDLVAQALHANSSRAGGRFVVVNCATLQEHFLESELLGHELGAFTGAVANKQGLLEVADGGTIFIDEVTEMTSRVQAMALRILETGRFRRMGATEERSVDVRVIAATNKNPEQEVAAGRFREDLYYRLNVLRISLPPLRERIEDVPVLVEHILKQQATEGAHRVQKEFSAGAMKALMKYSWPGNVRELENVVKQAALLSQGSRRITKRHLPARLTAAASSHRGTDKSLSEIERDHIESILKRVDGNKTAAAQILGVSRATLRRKMRDYGA